MGRRGHLNNDRRRHLNNKDTRDTSIIRIGEDTSIIRKDTSIVKLGMCMPH